MKALAGSTLMIDILQLVPLRPEVQKGWKRATACTARGTLTRLPPSCAVVSPNGHSGPPPR